MKKGVYKMDKSYGRMGDLEGVFIATEDQVKKLIESKLEVYFGEVLGKHSEVYGVINENDIEFITSDETVVRVLSNHNLTSGYNPFHYSVINFDEESVGLDPDSEYTAYDIVNHLLKNEEVN